ncbi:MAG: hypothetical protein KDD53_11285 [Bdellovibrionales bacterium]|nr:hypothetical protein [Bdellovibrionales bacterium]
MSAALNNDGTDGLGGTLQEDRRFICPTLLRSSRGLTQWVHECLASVSRTCHTSKVVFEFISSFPVTREDVVSLGLNLEISIPFIHQSGTTFYLSLLSLSAVSRRSHPSLLAEQQRALVALRADPGAAIQSGGEILKYFQQSDNRDFRRRIASFLALRKVTKDNFLYFERQIHYFLSRIFSYSSYEIARSLQSDRDFLLVVEESCEEQSVIFGLAMYTSYEVSGVQIGRVLLLGSLRETPGLGTLLGRLLLQEIGGRSNPPDLIYAESRIGSVIKTLLRNGFSVHSDAILEGHQMLSCQRREPLPVWFIRARGGRFLPVENMAFATLKRERLEGLLSIRETHIPCSPHHDYLWG